MTSVRSIHPEQYIPTDPAPVDPLNKLLPAIGQVHPRWRQRHAMTHGRYLSGLGGLAGAGPIAQKARDGQFEIGGSCDFLTDGDEPDWTDPLGAENETEDDSVGSGIFDQAGGATVHTDMGVFADHPAVPGYIARNPPFYVNPEVQDITADAQVLEVPGGGLNYLEHGGINVAPPISPFARYEPYVGYPCQSMFHPRAPDKWQAMAPPGAQPPLPMNAPPISANPPPPGSNIPVEQHHPSPRPHRYPSALGPVPHPWHPPSGGGRVPGSGGGVPGPNVQGGTGAQQPAPGGGSPTAPPGSVLHGYGQTPSFGPPPAAYVPPNTRTVPGFPPRPCNPRHPYGTLVPFQRIVDPIDLAIPVDAGGPLACPCPPPRRPLPPGMHGFGYFGEDPNTTPTPAPAPTQASATGPGIGSYIMGGVVLGVAAYLVVGATSGKAKR